MKNREALLDAGFEKSYDKPDCVTKVVNETRIYVNYKNLDIALHKSNDVTGTFPDSYCEVRALNLESVKNLLGCFGFDFDFTAKPKYDWETVKAKLSLSYIGMLEGNFKSTNRLAANGVILKQEAQSMIAKLKLNIIIRQIDEERPKELHNMTGIIYIEGGTIKAGHIADDCANEYLINTGSSVGAQILLDQNPQLLQNLFKIETDA